jgi:hypothetical protein
MVPMVLIEDVVVAARDLWTRGRQIDMLTATVKRRWPISAL